MIPMIWTMMLPCCVVICPIERYNLVTPVVINLNSVRVAIGKPIGILQVVLLSESQAACLPTEKEPMA